ncbi:MAG: hypothetical protein IJQ39_00535 [Thermoguttaceae bacterium]|nr:hypothetical protein [Thermoguttaceae bacterium]
MNISLKDKGRYIFWIGIALLTLRFVMAFKTGDFTRQEASLAATGLRAGILLTSIGLAWDYLIKMPLWLFIMISIATLLIIAWPRQSLFLIPLIFILFLIKRWFDKLLGPEPKTKKKKSRKKQNRKS